MTKRKSGSSFFLVGILVYALIFLALTAWGLGKFRRYLAAYELSRPETAINAYMQRVDAGYLCSGGASAVLERVDLRLQSEEACRSYIESTLTEDISYAKYRAECTEDRLVYMILCGKQPVCKVTLTRGEAGVYGFAPWQVTREEFDLSHITVNTASITVPRGYTVLLGEVPLDEAYITETDIPFDALADYYEGYAPPYLVTYTTGGYLGQQALRAVAPDGKSVAEGTDPQSLLSNCTDAEVRAMDPLVEGFIQSYVDFSSCADNDLQGHYQRLKEMLVPDCELQKRLYNAIDGLSWTKDRRSEISAITVHHRVDLGGDRYLYDVTYEVDTVLHNGANHETTNARFILAAAEQGFLIADMDTY